MEYHKYSMNQLKQKNKAKQEYVDSENDGDDIVRATFTMPQGDLDVIEELRLRFVKESGEILNRSEIVRAGLQALQGLSEPKLRAISKELERFKPGRQKR